MYRAPSGETLREYQSMLAGCSDPSSPPATWGGSERVLDPSPARLLIEVFPVAVVGTNMSYLTLAEIAWLLIRGIGPKGNTLHGTIGLLDRLVTSFQAW